MVMKFTNNATSTLASGITSSATSLTVATGNGTLFPTLGGSDYFFCTLANTSGTVEIVKVTARSTDTFTVTRGQDGTSGVAWNSGDKVELRLVAASLNDIPKLDEANTFTAANALGTPASIVLTNATSVPVNQATGTLAVGNGGTGATSLTANNVLLGNGTSALQVVAPGTSGNVLTSNGTTWSSVTPSGASGTVTSVATGNGLSGGTITTTGTLTIACPTFNTVGSYVLGLLRLDSGTATSGNNYSTGTGNNAIQALVFYPACFVGVGGTVNSLSGTWKYMNATASGIGSYIGIYCRVS
jgi:hypothetical protein